MVLRTVARIKGFYKKGRTQEGVQFFGLQVLYERKRNGKR